MSQVIQGFEGCPSWAPAFGYMGACICMVLSSWGSAWGTWRAGLGVCNMGIDHPAGVIKTIVPIVMAGVLGIYGLIVAVIIAQAVVPPNQGDATNVYSSYNGYTHFAAGLCCGLSCLAAGGTIGILGDVGVRGFGLTAENGCKWFWDPNAMEAEGAGGDEGGDQHVPMFNKNSAENANKLYVGMLIMLIFSEALALYGLIVALILSQHNYVCA